MTPDTATPPKPNAIPAEAIELARLAKMGSISYLKKYLCYPNHEKLLPDESNGRQILSIKVTKKIYLPGPVMDVKFFPSIFAAPNMKVVRGAKRRVKEIELKIEFADLAVKPELIKIEFNNGIDEAVLVHTIDTFNNTKI